MSQASKNCLYPGLLAVTILAASLKISAQDGYDKLKLTTYYQKQDFEGAVQYLESFSGEKGGTPSFHKDMGYALYMNDEYKEAKPNFETVLRLEPTNLEANLYLAQIFYSMGNLDSSLYFYNVLVKLNPQQYRFWQKAGNLHYRLSNYDSSFIYYQEAYRLNNRSGRIAVDLTNLFIQKKQYNSADSLINEFLSRDTLEEEVIAKKIEISFKKSVYDTAIFWGEKLWRDSSQMIQPFISLAYSYLNKEQYNTCIQLCDWLNFKNRAGQSILYCAALAYSKTGRYTESNDKLDLCLKMSIQEDAHTYLSAKGDNFENMKNYNKAISYYDTAWYIFHKPFDLYFAGRIYDKFYKNPVKATSYYKLFQKNRNQPGNTGEKRVMDYVDDFLRQRKKQ
ncbi:MAG: CDC27 family protein [Bacteroidota bacterium]